MHTKILKIHYPSATANEIGAISATVREKILGMFKGNTISFSFSSNKESGYIMVYPTAPILSIRISTHEADGSVPVDNLLVESDDKRTLVINAEAEQGAIVTEGILLQMLAEAKVKGIDIKNLIKELDI